MASAALGSKAYAQSEWEDEIWAVVFATVGATSAPPPGGKLNGLFTKAKTWAKQQANPPLVPNPFFVLNGICEAEDENSPKTAAYQHGRRAKKVASTVQDLATGHFLKPVTVVDPVSIAKTGVSIGATIAHMAALEAIAKKWRNSQTISRWVGCLVAMKGCKLGKKTLAIVSASIPGLPPIAEKVLSAVSSVAETGVKKATDAVVTRIAIELHWRAYREQVLARSGGAVGPASAVLVELFTKRTESRILGKYDTDAIIREPAGWMAIKDKIGLL